MLKKTAVAVFVMIAGLLLVSGCGKSTTSPETTVTTKETPQWTLVSTVFLSGEFLRGFASSEGNLLVFFSQGIFYSTDNGSTWSPASIPSSASINTIAAKGNIVFASTNSGIYRSADNGISWNLINQTFYSLSFAFSTIDNTVFAASDSGVFSSSDNGVRWSPLNSGLPSNVMGYSIVYKTFYYNGYCYTNTDSGFYRTSGIQTPWQKADQGLSVGDGVWALSGYENTVFAAVNFGVFRSMDNGTSWTATSLVMMGVQYIVVNGKTVFAATNRGQVLYSKDNGASWCQAGAGLTSAGQIIVHNGNLFCLINGINQIWRLDLSGF
jgi:photosystem II stability/assembly factor-like uncharacterized protein